MNLYVPDGVRTKALLAKARIVNRDRDTADIQSGRGSLLSNGFDVFFHAVLSALDAGIDREDWGRVAEAMDLIGWLDWKIQKNVRADPTGISAANCPAGRNDVP